MTLKRKIEKLEALEKKQFTIAIMFGIKSKEYQAITKEIIDLYAKL